MFGRKPPLAKTFLSHALIVSVREKTPGNTNSFSQGFVKRDQASLPFDMRRTKPLLLKHTTSFPFIQTIAIVPFLPRLITAYCYLYSRISERILPLIDKFVTRRLLMHPGYKRSFFFSQVRRGVLLSAADRQIFGQRSKSRSIPKFKSSGPRL